VKKTFAYKDIQTNEKLNKAQIDQSRLSLDLKTLVMLTLIIMWITKTIYFDFSHDVFIVYVHTGPT